MRMNDSPRALAVIILVLFSLACGGRNDDERRPWGGTGAGFSTGSSDGDSGTGGDGPEMFDLAGADEGTDSGQADSGTNGGETTGSEETTDTGSTTTGDDGDYSGPYAMERKLCVDMNNMFRVQMNVPPLQRYSEKEPCVDEQAEQESLIDTPHGKLGACGELRQNHGDGTGWGNLELIDYILNDQFNEGPGGPHYEQMLDPNMTKIACGFYENANGNFWINIDFW